MMFMFDGDAYSAATMAATLKRGKTARVERYGAVGGTAALLLGEADAANEPGLVMIETLFAGGDVGVAAGAFLFKVGVWTPEADREDFLAWYRGEHLPMLLECPTWRGCRFVEAPAREGHQYFALHQLADPSALDSEARKRSRATPWFIRLKRHSWFDEAFTRQLYRSMEG